MSSIHKSSIDTATIVEATGKRLLSFNATCWNSQLKIIRRFDEVLQSDPNILDKLNASIRIVRELLILLLPFEDAADVIQGENTMASFVIPGIVGIKAMLKELEVNKSIHT